MRVKVLSKVWQLLHVPASDLPRGVLGDCDGPGVVGKRVRISSKAGERHLEIVLHELLHAADWHKDEEWVHQVAKDLARGLVRLGYRRVTE